MAEEGNLVVLLAEFVMVVAMDLVAEIVVVVAVAAVVLAVVVKQQAVE